MSDRTKTNSYQLHSPVEFSFLLDPLFPEWHVHLIGGSPGAGKTTFLFQFLRDWSAGLPFLGQKGNIRKFVYLAMDRTPQEIVSRFRATGLDENFCEWYSLYDMQPKKFESLLPLIREEHGLIVIEAIQVLQQGEIKEYKDSNNFLSMLTAWCQTNKKTIIGTVHMPKMKSDSTYSKSRDKVFGSVGFSAFSSTVISIDDSVDPAGEKCRSITLCPRMGPEEIRLAYLTDTGALDIQPPQLSTKEMRYREALPDSFSTQQFWEIVEQVDGKEVSEKTIYRYLSNMAQAGLIEKAAHGQYRVLFRQTR